MFTAIPSIQHRKIDLRSIKLQLTDLERGKKREVESLVIDGEPCIYTDRFEKSICHLFRQHDSVFTLFEPAEVIERGIERLTTTQHAQITLAEGAEGKFRALSVIPPKENHVDVERYCDILDSESLEDKAVRYEDGIVQSFHHPVAKQPFTILGDDFIPGFTLKVPIDGYGSSNSFLSLLRQVCKNGSIALAPAFRTQIKMGKHSPEKVVARFLRTFNNEEGYAVIRERLETASSSYASLNEYSKLRNILSASTVDSTKKGWDEVCKELDSRAGDILSRYTISGIQQLPVKIQQRIPTEISIYDLFNFATEIGTHFATQNGHRRINGLMGTMLSEEGGYDLEGSKLKGETPEELFLEASKN